MENSTKNLSDAAAMAQFKLALIAPVIHGLLPDASRNAYCRRVTAEPLTLPDGSVFRYSPGTISKWVSLCQCGGFDALMPRERSDKGSARALPDTAIEEIYRVREAFPRLNATQIHAHLVEEAFIPATVSVCAVQRFVKKHDLKSARSPGMRDRKAFEEDAFGKDVESHAGMAWRTRATFLTSRRTGGAGGSTASWSSTTTPASSWAAASSTATAPTTSRRCSRTPWRPTGSRRSFMWTTATAT